MNKIIHKTLVCALMLAVSGCGFRPIYYKEKTAPEESFMPQEFKIAIKGMPENSHLYYKLRRELDVLLPTIPQKIPHILHVFITLESFFGDVALNSKAKVLRRQGYLEAQLEVSDFHSQKSTHPLLRQKIESITSYSVQEEEELAIIFAEEGANDRMIADIAKRITHALANMPV